MATGYDDDVEMRATWAQLNGNNRGKGSSLSNFMLQRMMLGNRTPARSNKEGLGRFLAPLLVGLAAQGFQSWKDNYDARGRAKDNADAIMERYRQTGQITDAERATLAQMQNKYKDNPKYQGRWDIGAQPPITQGGAQPPATPAPQGNPVPEGINADAVRAGLKDAMGTPSFEDPSQKIDIAPSLDGAMLADEAKQSLSDAIKRMGVQGDGSNDWLKNIFGGRW